MPKIDKPGIDLGAWASSSKDNRDRLTSVGIVLKLVFITLLLVAIFGTLVGSDRVLTFRALIEWLANYTPAIPSLNFIDLTIHGDWGIIDGLRNFLNLFAQIFSFIVYLGGALVNLISYITGLVQFLFVG